MADKGCRKRARETKEGKNGKNEKSGNVAKIGNKTIGKNGKNGKNEKNKKRNTVNPFFAFKIARTCLVKILTFLPCRDIYRFSVTCSALKKETEDEKLWQKIAKQFSWMRPFKHWDESWTNFCRRLRFSHSYLVIHGGNSNDRDSTNMVFTNSEEKKFIVASRRDIGFHRSVEYERLEGPSLSVLPDETYVCMGGMLENSSSNSVSHYEILPCGRPMDRKMVFSKKIGEFPKLRTPRCYAASICVQNKLFCIAGAETPYANFGDVYSMVECLDLKSPNEWKNCPSIGHIRSGHSAALLDQGNTLVVIGGYGGGSKFLNTMEIFDLNRSTAWTTDLRRMINVRSGFGFVKGPDRCLYVVGGSSNGEEMLSAVERLDPREKKGWQPLAEMKHRRGYCSAMFDAFGTLYAVGGTENWGPSDSAGRTFEMYDTRANRWEVIKDGELPFSRHSMVTSLCLESPKRFSELDAIWRRVK